MAKNKEFLITLKADKLKLVSVALHFVIDNPRIFPDYDKSSSTIGIFYNVRDGYEEEYNEAVDILQAEGLIEFGTVLSDVKTEIKTNDKILLNSAQPVLPVEEDYSGIINKWLDIRS